MPWPLPARRQPKPAGPSAPEGRCKGMIPVTHRPGMPCAARRCRRSITAWVVGCARWSGPDQDATPESELFPDDGGGGREGRTCVRFPPCIASMSGRKSRELQSPTSSEHRLLAGEDNRVDERDRKSGTLAMLTSAIAVSDCERDIDVGRCGDGRFVRQGIEIEGEVEGKGIASLSCRWALHPQHDAMGVDHSAEARPVVMREVRSFLAGSTRALMNRTATRSIARAWTTPGRTQALRRRRM